MPIARGSELAWRTVPTVAIVVVASSRHTTWRTTHGMNRVPCSVRRVALAVLGRMRHTPCSSSSSMRRTIRSSSADAIFSLVCERASSDGTMIAGGSYRVTTQATRCFPRQPVGVYGPRRIIASVDSIGGSGRARRGNLRELAETCGRKLAGTCGNLQELPCTSRRSVGCRFGSPGADVARVRFSARHPGADTGFHLLRAAADRPLAGGGEDGLAQRLALAVLQHKPRRHPHGHGPRRRRASARRRRVGRARESRECAGARVAADALDAEHVLGVVRQPLCALRRRGSIVGAW